MSKFDTNYWVSDLKKSLRCEDRNRNRILILENRKLETEEGQRRSYTNWKGARILPGGGIWEIWVTN